MSSPPHVESRFDVALLAAVAGASSLRLGLVWISPEVQPVNDEIGYLNLAKQLVAGGGFGTNFRPPLYPGFIAAVLDLFPSVAAVRAVQGLLGAGSVVLVYLLAQPIGGRRAARIAAFLVALDPVLVGFSHLLWTETLFITLLLSAIYLLLRRSSGPDAVDWGAAGVCFGLAGLTRPVLLSFLPLLLPWAWHQARRRGPGHLRSTSRAFAALAVGASAVVLPWTARNAVLHGTLIVVDTNGPYNLLVSTEPGAFQLDKDDRWSPRWAMIGADRYVVASEKDPARAQGVALERAWRRIRARPGRFLQKSLWEAEHLSTLDNFVLRHLRNGWYPEKPSAFVVATITLLCASFTLLFWGAGSVGLVAQRPSPFRGLAVLLVLHSVVMFGLTYSLSRYAVPLRPILAIAAAVLLANPGAALARLRGGGRAAARAVLCGAIALWLIAAWSRDVPLLVDMVATGGSNFPFFRIPS